MTLAPRRKRGSERMWRTWHRCSAMPTPDRIRPFEDYCVGLLSEGRKSVEPLAAVTALHFVPQAPWSDQAMLRRVRDWALPSITRDEPIQAWIIDDTGFPKPAEPEPISLM